MKNKMGLIVAIAVIFFSTSASADTITINSPMTLFQQYIVGAIETGPLGPVTDEVAAAQVLLDFGKGVFNEQKDADGDGAYEYYYTNTQYDYSGLLKTSVTDADKVDKPTLAQLEISGYDYVMAKYDGQSAGYVLFYTGGNTITIPYYPYDLWTYNREKWGISHWVGFKADPGNAVPEPATMLLFGTGLIGFAGMARRKK